MKTSKKILVGNWKMQPGEVRDAEKAVGAIKKGSATLRNVAVVVCPPTVFLDRLIKLPGGKKVAFGAQNISSQKTGAFTGEISAQMVKSVKAEYVLVGHSERRAMGETDAEINKKVIQGLDAGLQPILCVGESKRDNDAAYLDVLRTQLKTCLHSISQKQFGTIMIAYEPVWAIGTSFEAAMKPNDVHQTVLFIRKVISELYKKDDALKVCILYGGSVATTNVGLIVAQGGVQGVLVGRQSVDPKSFMEIAEIVNNL